MPSIEGAELLVVSTADDGWYVDPLESTSASISYTDSVGSLDGVDCLLVDGDSVGDPVRTIADATDSRPDVPVLYLTSDDEQRRVADALEAGAVDFATADVPAVLPRRIAPSLPETAPPASGTEANSSTDCEIPHRDARLLEDLLSGLLDESGNVVYFKDDRSRFVRVSRSKARERDTTREAMRGNSDFDYMAESSARARYEDEQRIMRTEEGIKGVEERIVREDGEVVWYRTTKFPRYDEAGNVVGTFGISRDVTDLKELEATLGEVEEVIDRVPVWLLALDDHHEVTWTNQAAEETFASPDTDLVGLSLDELTDRGHLDESFLDDYRATVEELRDGNGRDRTAVINDVPVLTSQGDTRVCDIRIRPRSHEQSTFRGTVVAFHDVTEQVEQERALQHQYDRLERLVETISHDLRNPLMVAHGKIKLASGGSDENTLEEALEAIERVNALIDELLKMAQEGRAVENPDTVSLADVARQAWRPFENGDATLTVEGDATVRGDEDRLVRLFENLYRNGIEHSGPDVTLRVGITGDGFYVADDGPGIPADVKDRIFEHGFTTDEEGTGLGLSIVEEITKAHGWTITVSDSDDGGARFDVTTGT